MIVLMEVRCIATNISSPMATKTSLITSAVNGSSLPRRGFSNSLNLDHQIAKIVDSQMLARQDNAAGCYLFDDSWSAYLRAWP